MIKVKNEKGYTAIDIAISIVILFILVSIVAMLSYNYNSTSREVELKSEATEIAISEIENMKNKTLEDIETEDPEYRNTTEIKEGFFREIIVQDYHDIDESKIEGIVKKVTVLIQYRFKGEQQKIELSTIISKEI